MTAMKTIDDWRIEPFSMQLSLSDLERLRWIRTKSRLVSSAEVFREALKVYEVHLKQKES